MTLEEKYADQMRQIFPTKIDLPMFTLKTQIEEQINLAPDFQRRERWNDERRSRFIESIIMNVPIPPVFLGEEDYGRYVVLDGRQRLTAAYDFLSDRLRLKGLKVWKELNGNNYSDLKRKGLERTIERRFLPAVLLTRESSPEVKYDVFDRLNTGGVVANPMEVRNAIYRGPFSKLLHALSADADFRALWGIPEDRTELEKNTLFREMHDLELVLRFFALMPGTLGGLRFKDRLSETMLEKNREYEERPKAAADDKERFLRAIGKAKVILGAEAFRRREKSGELGSRSVPFADAILQAMGDIQEPVESALVPKIRAALTGLWSNETFLAAVSTGTNGESAIRVRISLARRAVGEALGRVVDDASGGQTGLTIPKRRRKT